MREQGTRRERWLEEAVWLGALALAAVILAVWALRITAPASVAAVPAAAAEPARLDRAFTLFGSDATAASGDASAALPRLLGTVQTGTGRGYAVVRDAGGSVRTVVPGERYAADWTLETVERDRVLLRGTDGLHELPLPARTPVARASEISAPTGAIRAGALRP
jgi:hypothetical protein